MDTKGIGEFVHALGHEIDHGTSTPGWVHTNCPLAEWRHEHGTDNNPSFGIKIDPGAESRVHCLSCNFSGLLGDVLVDLKVHRDACPDVDLKTAMILVANEIDESEVASLDNIGDYEDTERAKFRRPHIFPEEWLSSFPPAWKVKDARAYLQGRNVDADTAQALDLRWSGTGKRVCFPVRDDQGRLRGLHGRTIEDDVKPTYKMFQCQGKNNPDVWLGEHWLDLDEPVVFVESVFDLAAVYPIYKNVACPLTASLMVEKIKRMADVVEAFTFMDGDKAGKAGADKIKEVLNGYGVKVTIVDLPPKKDPGNLPAWKLETLIKEHVEGY